MLERITFKNHMGEMIEFGENGLYLNINDLHSYKWSYSSRNRKISFFNRDVQEKTLPIVVVCGSRDAGNQIMNQLMELSEKDILVKKNGQIIVGDYYLNCFIFGSQKSNYDLSKGVFYANLDVVTDTPAWIKEINQSFNNTSGGSGSNLDHPYDFPYDFTSPSSIRELVNSGFADTDFKMILFGEVTDPTIFIAGHEYSITGHIEDREYVEIDSRSKTVTLVKNDGERVNWFSHRDKENYIFQKIPSGVSQVSWQGDYRFDITLFEERSEPKWT